MFGNVVAFISSVAVAACSVVGIRGETEEPSYQTVAQVGDIEIRSYGARIAAQTVVAADEEAARSIGFQRLAGYIFGRNHARAKIAMTAPVGQEPAGAGRDGERIAMTAPVAQDRDAQGGSVIRFFMPAKYRMDDLPQPDDPVVTLVQVPPETIAVLRFSGSRDPQSITAREKQLMATLATSKWHAAGEPVAWFYDPPWTLPPLRRNEVAVRVEN